MDGDDTAAERREHPDFCGSDQRARIEHLISECYIFPRVTDVRTRLGRDADLHPVSVACGVLLHHDRVAARWNGSAGQDSSGLARSHGAIGGSAGGNFGDHFEGYGMLSGRRGQVRAADREAVHRGLVRGGELAVRTDALDEHPAASVRDRSRLRAE